MKANDVWRIGDEFGPLYNIIKGIYYIKSKSEALKLFKQFKVD